MGNMKPIDSAVVKNETYDVLSADTMGGEYIETIGAACQNPDGYTSGSLFLGKDNDVQHLYRATAAIAFGETIILDTNCTYTTVSGELEGKAEESEVTSLNEALTNEVATRATNGAHNLVKTIWTTQAYQGLNTVVNTTDGTISISGSNNKAWNAVMKVAEASLKAGSYRIHKAPSGAQNDTTYWFQLQNKANSAVIVSYIETEDVTFTLASDLDIVLVVMVKGNYSISGTVKFEPMITLASDIDPTYTPYAMTNRELTDATETLRKNATNRDLYYNNSGTFVADSSVTLSDNNWTLAEILMYTNNTNSSSRTCVLIYKNHISPGPHLPIIDNEDRTKMAYFRPIGYSNKVLSFQASCPVMIISVKPIV